MNWTFFWIILIIGVALYVAWMFYSQREVAYLSILLYRNGDADAYLKELDTFQGKLYFNKRLRMWCDSAEPDRIKMWQKAGYRAKGVNKETNSVHAQIDYLKQHRIHIHPSCVNTIKEIQQWKWKKDERTNTYLEEPVPFFDDAMAMLRYSIEEERKAKPRLNRNLKGGL